PAARRVLERASGCVGHLTLEMDHFGLLFVRELSPILQLVVERFEAGGAIRRKGGEQLSPPGHARLLLFSSSWLGWLHTRAVDLRPHGLPRDHGPHASPYGGESSTHDPVADGLIAESERERRLTGGEQIPRSSWAPRSQGLLREVAYELHILGVVGPPRPAKLLDVSLHSSEALLRICDWRGAGHQRHPRGWAENRVTQKAKIGNNAKNPITWWRSGRAR